MAKQHEYTLLSGVNRASVGRWIASVAAVISALAVFAALSLVDIATHFGMSVNLPPTALSLLGAGTVYGMLYWLFNGYGWRMGKMPEILKIPDLSGEWKCEGVTVNKANAPWTGRIRIAQSWDRIFITLTTDKSVSESVAAAIQYSPGLGYHVM